MTLLSRLQRLEKNVNFPDYIYNMLLKKTIPTEPALFYKQLGLLEHQSTLKPVFTLTPYQLRIWKMRHQIVDYHLSD